MNEIMSTSDTEALLVRHGALLERVEKLERALEEVADWNHESFPEDAWRVVADARKALED